MSSAERKGPGESRRDGAETPTGLPWDEPPEGEADASPATPATHDDENFGPADRLGRAQRLAAARGIATGAGRRADQEELLAMLQQPPAEPPPSSLDDVTARPGEVPSLHSDRSLYALWISLAITVLAVVALGVWAVFLRKPF